MSEDKQVFDRSSVVPDGILAEKLKNRKSPPMTRPSANYPGIALDRPSPFLKQAAPVPVPSVTDSPREVSTDTPAMSEAIAEDISEEIIEENVELPVFEESVVAEDMTVEVAEITSDPVPLTPEPKPELEPEPESKPKPELERIPEVEISKSESESKLVATKEVITDVDNLDISSLDIEAKDKLYRQLREELGSSTDEDLSKTNPPPKPIRVDNDSLITISKFPKDMVAFFDNYIEFLIGDDENLRKSLSNLSRTRLMQAVCVAMSAGGIVTDDQVVIAAARLLSANQLNSVMLMNNVDRLRSVIGNVFTDVRKMSKTVSSVQNMVEANGLINAYHLGSYLDVLPRNEVNMADGVTPRYDHPVTLGMIDTTKQLAAKQLQIEKDRQGRNFRRNDKRR